MSYVFVDWMIQDLCYKSTLVDPAAAHLINPASLDLRLGDHLMIESCEQDFVRYDLTGHSHQKPYMLGPGQFVLAPSLETINLPVNILGEVFLKSSVARMGLDMSKAGYCDPGWNGSKLTMPLKNVRQLGAVPLWPGMPIVQLKLTWLTHRPNAHYGKTGRYNGDQGAQVAKL